MEQTDVRERHARTFIVKALLLAAVLLLVVGFHTLINDVVYPKLVYAAAQQAVNRFLFGDVDCIGSVEIDTQGDIAIRGMTISTTATGDRRIFYRAERVNLSFDGMPLEDDDIRLSRIEFHRPEIFLVKRAGGRWNIEDIVIRQPRAQHAELQEVFPANGIHIYDGILHLTHIGESGEELTWRLEKVRCSLSLDAAGKIRVGDVSARLYGGRVRISIDLTGHEPPAYAVRLHVWDARVEEIVRGTPFEKAGIAGLLDVVMTMEVVPSAAVDRPVAAPPVAANYLRIRNGHIWDLPVFLGILNILNLKAPAGASFDEALVHFTVEPKRVRVDDMQFLGYPVSLFGDGEIGLDGERIDMVFIPKLGKGGLESIPLVGPPVQILLDVVKGALVPIVVKGSFAHPEVSVQPGRPIAEPVRQLIKLFTGE